MLTQTSNHMSTSELLRGFAETLSGVVGEAYFTQLTAFLAERLDVQFALVGELVGEGCAKVRTIALYADGALRDNTTYELADTPCEHVITDKSVYVHTSNIQPDFPKDIMLRDMGVEGYVGAPLIASDGSVLGLLAVLTRLPVSNPDVIANLFGLIAWRTSAEIERLRTDNAFQLGQERFRDFAECSSDWFWEMDADLRFCYFSERFREVSGVPPERLLGKTREETGIPGVDVAAWEQHLADLHAHRPFRNFTHPRTQDDGSVKWLSISGQPHFDVNGTFKGYRGVGSDITRLKETEAALRHAKTSAEVASNAKSEFLATMSHEIRTPMTGVIGMAQLLLGSPLAPDQQHKVETIISSGNALLTILNDVLDLSRLEAGKIEIEAADFVLADMIKGVTDLLVGKAEEKGLDLVCDLDAGLPQQICADNMRVRQVLINLIGNAIKFTERGEVRLSVAQERGSANGLFLSFEVTDTGIGIAPEHVGRLFDKFEQVDASASQSHGGSGLGLAIARKLVERMGGEIGVDSQEGQGSRFWFTLPVGARAAQPVPRSSEAADDIGTASRTLKLLVAEDNHVNQLIFTAMLGRLGHRIDVAGNGEEAVAAARQGGYDAILMDMRMPKKDGFQATREIRALDGDAGAVPIIAVTADTMSRSPVELREAGMSGWVSKPISQRLLFEEIDKVLGEAVHGTGAVASGAGAARA